MFFRHGEHTTGTAGRVINLYNNMTLAEFPHILIRIEEKIYHEFDNLSWGKMFSGLFVSLLSAYSNEFFEDISHLHVVDLIRR